MSKTFNGICIGGPLDGQMIARPDRHFEAEKFAQTTTQIAAVLAGPDAVPKDLMCNRVRYRYYPLATPGVYTGIWCDDDHTPADAVQALFDAYAARKTK